MSAQEPSSAWPQFGGDAGRTGWEKQDAKITTRSVKDFQQVLKQKLKSSSVTPPVIGQIEGKELGFVLDGSDHVSAIDLNADRMLWEKPLSSGRRRPCVTTGLAIPSAMAQPALSGGSVFSLSSDGKLHKLNAATGEESAPAQQFVPPLSLATNLAVQGGAIYTVTEPSCGAATGVWAMDISTGGMTKGPVANFKASTLGDPAFGADGTVYLQTGQGLNALTPGGLTLKRRIPGITGDMTPVLFTYKGKDRIVTASASGSLHVSDGAADLFKTSPLGHVMGLAAWESPEGVRYIVATINESVTAFKLDGGNKLTAAWTSPALLNSPVPPVIAGGVVFVLSKGAVLYGLDGITGESLYSSGKITGPTSAGSGMTVANGRVYFATTDGTLYGFGASPTP